MSNIVRFDDFVDAEIRVTDDGQYSVFDVIKFCGQKNPHEAWTRITEKFPALTATPRHRFKGQGQKDIPVMDFDGVTWLISFLRKDTGSVTICPPDCLVNGAYVSEFAFRDALRDFYIECGEKVNTEVRCEVGILDIVTSTTVVEVKHIRGWKSAIGQAVSGATCLGKAPEVALYGNSSQHNFDLIVGYCTRMNVACSIWDTLNGDAFTFLLGQGCWTVTNQDMLTEKMKKSNQATLN